MRRLQRAAVERRTTSTGWVADSVFERDVVQDLIDRGVGFTFHPVTREYGSKVAGAYCAECDSRKVVQPRKYTMDVELENGRWIEIKGKFPAHKRRLMAEFVKQHGPISFVFQRDNRLNKGKPTKYSDWANKHGCPWALGRVPETWL